MCTVKFNTFKMPRHNTKMCKKHYSSTNMQKSFSFMSFLFWYFKGAIFCSTELWAQGQDLSTNQDSILEWILYFKYDIQSLNTCYKQRVVPESKDFVFCFFPCRKALVFFISFIMRNYQWETSKRPSVQASDCSNLAKTDDFFENINAALEKVTMRNTTYTLNMIINPINLFQGLSQGL